MKRILLIIIVLVFGIDASSLFSQNDSLMLHYKGGKVDAIRLSTIYKANLDINQNGSQDIILKTGWNFISSNIIPLGKDSINQIFTEVLNKILIVKNRVGESFIPSYDIDQIKSWNYKTSYLVYSTANDTFKIEGIIAKPSKESINLVSGWNWVPYLRAEPLLATTALASISGANQLLIAKDISGNVYIPSYGINTIGDMKNGTGYQLFLQSNAILSYPE